MKTLRVMVCTLPLVLGGCSTLSSFHWAGLAPWNWFGSSLTVTEKGLGDITATTPLTQAAIADALSGYTLRSGMKTHNGTVVRYFEAVKENNVMIVVNGDKGTVNRIDVMDRDIASAGGARIGSAFHDIYERAQGSCEIGSGDDGANVDCLAPGSQHIHYVFSGEWSGPSGLIPPDDTLKNWSLHKIVWQQ